jgi:hypothetical protein
MKTVGTKKPQGKIVQVSKGNLESTLCVRNITNQKTYALLTIMLCSFMKVTLKGHLLAYVTLLKHMNGLTFSFNLSASKMFLKSPCAGLFHLRFSNNNWQPSHTSVTNSNNSRCELVVLIPCSSEFVY